MNSAKKIIEKFDGAQTLSKLLGVPQRTVYLWSETGRIPQKYHDAILDAGQAVGAGLIATDFLPVNPEDPRLG